MSSVSKINLLDMDREDMCAFFTGMGEKSFRGDQVLKWIYQHDTDDFEEMTNLGIELRSRMNEVADIRMPEIADDQMSRDGTRKWLLKLADGNHIEMVFIPEEGRGTLCISSQVGCALNCSFCHTARQGFNRNLDVSEIISQLRIASRILGKSEHNSSFITNIVMMGMGEPLLNFDNVIKAIAIMKDDLAYGLSKRRITLSTAGLVPGIDKLCQTSDVSLAVSLHAPNDELRTRLVPLNKKYPIRELLEACKRYISVKKRRKVTFEYVLLAGINDAPQHAMELARLINDIPAKVNLIPFNGFDGAGYECPEQDTIDRFRNILMAAGLVTVTRKTRGDDIAAACGQLAGKFHDRTRRSTMSAHVAGGGII